MQKIGWLLLLIATIGDFVVPYLLAPFYRGYRHTKQVMSVLGNPESPVKALYNAWLLALGILLMAATPSIVGLYSAVSPGISLALAVLVLVFAIGAGVLAGIFCVNSTKEEKSTASQIHGIGSATGFMALLFAPLLVSVLSFKQHDMSMGIASATCFVLAVGFFVLFVLADKPRFAHTLISGEGLWQRLSLAFMYIPFVLLGLQNR